MEVTGHEEGQPKLENGGEGLALWVGGEKHAIKDEEDFDGLNLVRGEEGGDLVVCFSIGRLEMPGDRLICA